MITHNPLDFTPEEIDLIRLEATIGLKVLLWMGVLALPLLFGLLLKKR